MKKKSFLSKAALAAITIWGGSYSTNDYTLSSQFWQFNLKQIDKEY
jgi:hypothetical protein